MSGTQQPNLLTNKLQQSGRLFGATDLVTPALGLVLLDAVGNPASGAPLDDATNVDDVTKSAVETVAAFGGAITGDDEAGGRVVADTVSQIVGIETLPAIGGDGLDGLGNLTGDIICVECLGLGDVLALDGPILAPVADVANNIVDDFHVLLVDTAQQLGEPAASAVVALVKFGSAAGFGNTGEESNHLVSSVLELPDAALDGDLDQAICNVVDDLEDTTAAAGNFINEVLDDIGINDPLDTGLIHDIAGNLGGGPLLDTDLINLGDRPLLEAVVDSGLSQTGALIDIDLAGDGNPSTSQHLIDVDLGPSGGDGIGAINVLSQAIGDHTAEVNVLDVGSDGPRLLDVDLFTDDNFLADASDLDLADDIPALPALGSGDTGHLGDIGALPPADIGGILFSALDAKGITSGNQGLLPL